MRSYGYMQLFYVDLLLHVCATNRYRLDHLIFVHTGLITTEQPAASAGPTLRAIMAAGKFYLCVPIISSCAMRP